MSILVYYRALGELGANCYFLINSDNNECVIVDPGAEAAKIKLLVADKGIKPVAILLTHGHYDHIMASKQVSELYDIDIYAGEKELEVLKSGTYNLSAHFGKMYTVDNAKPLSDGQVITLAGMDIKVIATPGHTIGGVCYYVEAQHFLISGDTLFYGSFGRYDFPTGNVKDLADSIKNKLFTLPEDTICYPGHGSETTIGYEKINNPISHY